MRRTFEVTFSPSWFHREPGGAPSTRPCRDGLGGITPNVSYQPQPGPPTRKSLITRIDPAVPGFLKTVEPDHGSNVADSLKIG